MPSKGYAHARKMAARPKNKRGGNPTQEDGLSCKEPGSMSALYPEYFERLAVLNYSPRSMISRRKELIFFLIWCEERDLLYPKQITKTILEAYQRYLYHYRKSNDKPLSYRSKYLRTGSVKAFFKWLCKQNYLPWNPASELEMPRPEIRLPQTVFSAHEVEQILNVPDINDPLGIRDRAIIELFYSTGIRRSEMVNLCVEDLNRECYVLSIRQGKGKKDRTVPVGKRALHWLNLYLDSVRDKLTLSQHQRSLFLTGYGEPFNPDVLSRMVTRYINKADIGKSASCHAFRHTCATLMLENGADIRFVQQLLGHADISATQIYTQVSIKQLQKVHAETHPADQQPPQSKLNP